MLAPRPIPIRPSRAFTLVECLCSITVIGVVAAVVLPVINSATTSCVNGARARDVSENAAYALDRCLDMLRSAPLTADGDDVDVIAATPTSIAFADGRGFSCAGGVLTVTDASGVTAPLLRDVQGFTLDHLAQDSVTATLGAPENTWIYALSLTTAGFELRGTAFVRARRAAP